MISSVYCKNQLARGRSQMQKNDPTIPMVILVGSFRELTRENIRFFRKPISQGNENSSKDLFSCILDVKSSGPINSGRVAVDRGPWDLLLPCLKEIRSGRCCGKH